MRNFLVLAAALSILGCTDQLDALRTGADFGVSRDSEPDDAPLGDAADLGVRDTPPDEPQFICCVDLLCEGCNGVEFLVGGCDPEFCEPPFPDVECPVVSVNECPDCTMLPEAECGEGYQGKPGCAALRCDDGYRGCYPANARPQC